MRHLALILLTSSFFTACMTDTDKALWSETKETFATGKFASLDAAAPDSSNVADSENEKVQDKDVEAIEAPKPSEATTGR
ncbi:MAG: hypothetical protein EOP04_25175 [Proteobacteria bacterium]|nr:MAG: hypothetical protein EOP04_25175 [Pseudomonadota bacterium]